MGRLLLLTAALFALGCTRAGKESAQVRLAVPADAALKSGSLSLDLAVIIVNVSGPGLTAPKVYQWDRHSCANGGCAVPSEISMEVPRGGSLVFQYLAVYEDASQMVFKYGDAEQTMKAADEVVNITLAQVGSSTTQGHISGRYMISGHPQGGPTGMVVAKFKPPGGKPAMSIMRSYMVAGWFNDFMAMDGTARFSYFLNGNPIFEDLHLGSATLAGSANVLKVNVPSYDRDEYENGASVRRTQGAEKIFLGYFGSGAGANRPCFDNRPDLAISGVYEAGTSTPMNWDGTSPSASEIGPQASTGLGFDPSGGASFCNDASKEYIDHIVFHHERMNNGHDSVTGFRGVLRAQDIGGYADYIVSTFNSGTSALSLNWKYLPQVTNGASGIKGVDVFRRAASAGNIDAEGMDGIDCALLSEKNFSLAVHSAETVADQVSDSVVVPSISNPGNVEIVLCPFAFNGASKVYAGAGMEVHTDNYSGGGGGAANDISLEVPEFSGQMRYANTLCVPMNLKAMSGAYPANFPSGATLTLTTSSADIKVYTNDYCSAQITAPVSVSGNNYQFYMKSTLAGNASGTVTASVGGALSATKSKTFSLQDAPGTPVRVYAVRAPASVYAYECNIVAIESWHKDGSDPAVLIAPPGGSLNLPIANTDLKFYSINTTPCSGTNSPYASFGGSSAVARAYFRFEGAGLTPLDLQPITANTYVGGQSVAVQQPGALNKVSVYISPSVEDGVCYPVDIRPTDSAGRIKPPASDLTVALAAAGGANFYDSNTCTSTSSSVTLLSGNMGTQRWIMGTVPGSVTLTFNSGLSVPVTTVPVTVLPATASQLRIVLPGQTLSGLNVTGTPSAQTVGMNFSVYFYALTYTGTIDTNFNGTMSYAYASVVTLPAASSIIFTGGVAMVPATPNASLGGETIYVEAPRLSGAIMNSTSSGFVINP